MSIAVSPVASEAASPMITSVTPTLESSTKEDPCRPGGSEDGVLQSPDRRQSYKKPPPLHTGADWKVVLHLPEIETWLRNTAERVRELTQSVQQDSLNRHVDAHLVQLKDICEDISDHVEQIHALLETEFSLKLLSYSVNIIVDIRSVQLLWHQLRVSVLVLKERLLQGLQDSNGNYTRQTDILQAFSQDHDQARLDSLTEVDDSGQLIIKCSQDYFSLDCGITAYELNDYSPGEDPEGRSTGQDPRSLYPELERDFPELLQSVDLLTIAASRQSQESSSPEQEEPPKSTQEPEGELTKPTQGSQNKLINQSPNTDMAMSGSNIYEDNLGLSKRPHQGSHSIEVSPTQPSTPKKPMYVDGSGLHYQADLSRSTPSLLDLPDRSKFWLELESVYPNSGSQSEENLCVLNAKNRQGHPQATIQKCLVPGRVQIPLQRSSSEAAHKYDAENSNCKPQRSETKQANSASSSRPPTSAEETTDHDSRESSSSLDGYLQTTDSLVIESKQGRQSSPKEECWYGSEEFLALPAQLKKTEMLALKLESLAQALPPRAMQQSVQDVDDWELTEANLEWETSTPPLPPRSSKNHFLTGRFSSASSDIAPSIDESIDSGPLSDLLSEDEGRWSAPKSQRVENISSQPEASRMVLHYTSLIQQLLEDIQHQENYQNIWGKLEGFVSKLDEFISWLREALESTENWTPPQADINSLRLYLETHLSFKLNVDSHCSLKDGLLEEGRQLLELITSHKSDLRDMLQMIAHQWQELQRQIRRQHSWMLHTLSMVKAHILAGDRDEDPKHTEDHDLHATPEMQVHLSHKEAQRDFLDQMNVKLKSQKYCSSSSRKKDLSLMSKSNSLSEFESEYQEIWDWLMDMESIVTDSHKLMMSEEQRHHLYKGNSVEMTIWLPKKTQLLGWAESLKRSSIELPDDFEEHITALRAKWDQLEKTLREHVDVSNGDPCARGLLSPGTSSMVAQLQFKIKELKSWLRETELFIFNLNLREDTLHNKRTINSSNAHQDPVLQNDPQPDQEQEPQIEPQAVKQLEHFKALCMEVRGRRRGMASVLRLCQRLLEGPEEQSSETERQSLRLLQVNLERRWEAIVMQVLQWQSHLKRTLGREQVSGNQMEPSLMDLRGPIEDSWEWDEMDMAIVNMESQEFDKQILLPQTHQCSAEEQLNTTESCPRHSTTSLNSPPSNTNSSHVYQVFSLHSMEMYKQPEFNQKTLKTPTKTKGKQTLLKSLSKDSSFSSAESLPDILAGLVSGKQALLTESTRRSESESGIVSEGDTETTANSEICLLYQSDDMKVQVTVTPPVLLESPGIDKVSDEDIDRILDRANKCAELGDSLANETKDQLYCMERRNREENGASRMLHNKESVEIFLNGQCLSPESEDEGHYTGAFSTRYDENSKVRRESTQLSHASSSDSLYAMGELFPSAKETLTRSMSLESWLAPCKSSGEACSQGSLGDIDLATESTGELSRRTLDLLKRLENIQTPLVQKLTRSISDITLQSNSLHLLGQGPCSGGAPSSINESLAASLTELSSIDDSSVASEDLAVQRNRFMAVNSNASFRKHSRSQHLMDDADANVSMVVNVSCTSACTDDEDDSDLLSSSTLTLTEEELGIKDDDSSITSEEEYIEGTFALGLDYVKGEFPGWIKPRAQIKEKNEADLGDELQCGAVSKEILSPVRAVSDRNVLNRSALKLLEGNANTKNDSLKQQEVDSDRRDATRNYIGSFVDDMENGNVDSSHIKGKDEDDLLREEKSLFTKTGESFKDCYNMDVLTRDMAIVMSSSPSLREQINLQLNESPLEGQLKGELPCYSSHRQNASLSPVEKCSTSHHKTLGTSHISSQDHFLDNFHESHTESSSDCCSHPSFPSEQEKSENVHSFVMEIIDMTSVALKTKEAQAEQPQESSSSTSASQIREKVLEHSHRPIHLRKGDFYSYLSLSSHDSDCGEVNTCTEDKSSTPVLARTPEICDEEPLFEACTEEVYLGPPLCYSMSISKRPMRRSNKIIDPISPMSQVPPPPCAEYQKVCGISPGSVDGTQSQCHNEAPYLNPLPCETLIDTVECFADTKMLESNISPVMTKIRVSCSSTNPLKEESSFYINPKINCPPIRKSDRDERGDASQWMKQKNVKKGHSSPQEAKATQKQLPRSASGSGLAETGRRVLFSTRHSDSSSAVKSGASSKPQAKRLSGRPAIPASKP